MRNLKVLAVWLANQAGVDVEVAQVTTAHIRLNDKGGKVIAIPESWSYSYDPDAYTLLEGVIDHEALGHGRFTDFDVMTSKAKSLKPYTKGLWNILEDIFIERRAIDTYPGVKRNLANTVEILVKRDFFGNPQLFAQNPDPAALVQAGLLNILRGTFIEGQKVHLQTNIDAIEPLLQQSLGQLWQDIMAIAVKVEKSKDTKTNLKLAMEIQKLIDTVSQQEPEPDEGDGDSEEQDQGEGDDQANQGGESGQGEQGQQQSEGSGQSGESEEGGDEQDSDASQAASQPSKGGKGSGKRYTQTEVDAAKKIMESLEEECQQQTELTDMICEVIEEIAGSGSSSQNLIDSDNKTKISDVALNVAKRLKSKSDDLQDALVSQTRNESKNALSGKRLNSRILSRVALGNSRVFKQKHEAQGLSTAVTVLVDCSGSMDDRLKDGVSRLDAAYGLMYGVGDMLTEFEVPFSVVGYSHLYQTFKNFDQDWGMMRRKLLVPNISGGTVTGGAMVRALTELAVRPEDRRLFIIITDGDTGDLEELMSCYSESKALGVEVATLIVGELVPSVTKLADKFGFKATTAVTSEGLSKFAVDRILEAI